MADDELLQAEHSKEDSFSKFESLSGKPLPSGWPTIISLEAENNGYNALYTNPEDRKTKPPNKTHIEALSFQLQNGDRRLRFFAAYHSPQPGDPNYIQYQYLEMLLNSSPPNVILYEATGNSGGTFASKEDALKHGETGFIQWWVQEHNKNNPDQQIELKGVDIPDIAVIEEYRKLQHPDTEIAVADMFSKLEFLANNIRNNPILTEEQRQQQFREIESVAKVDFKTFCERVGMPNLLPFLENNSGHPINQQELILSYEKITGKPFTMDLQRKDIPLLQKMWDENRIFRDQYIVEQGAKMFNVYDKVDYLFGSGHVREKQAWEEFFESDSEPIQLPKIA